MQTRYRLGAMLLFIATATAGPVGVGLAQEARVTQAQPIEFRNGRVFVAVHDVPLHDVLKLWEARTGTRFIHADLLPNERVTVELSGVSEGAALDALLKPAVGYVVRGRAEIGVPGLSQYAVVFVLTHRDLSDGGAAAKAAMDRAAKEMQATAAMFATGGERIVDYRDLPPRDPGDPNGPVGLTPASPGDTVPPPLAFPEGESFPGRDPGVNPIPANLPPPPPHPVTPQRDAPSSPPPAKANPVTPENSPAPVVPPKPGSKPAVVPPKPPGPGL